MLQHKTVSVRTEKAHLVKNSRNECNYSSDESTNCIHVTKYDRKMIATVTVANGKVKKLEVQMDTAATCNMLTRRDFAKMDKPRLTESTQAVTMYDDQRWSNRTRVLVLVFEYEYFLSTRTRTRVRRKVIVLVLEYITKVIVLTITSHD